MALGYVYILMNSATPDMVKIGKTTQSPEGRARELSGETGVPLPYVVAYAEELPYFDEAEQEIHQRLRAVRVNPRREFFRIPLKDAIRLVAETAIRYRERKAREDAWWGAERRRHAAEAAAMEQRRQAETTVEEALEGWAIEEPAAYSSETEQGHVNDILVPSQMAAPVPAAYEPSDLIVYACPDAPHKSLLRSPFEFALIFMLLAGVLALGFCLFSALAGAAH